MERKCLYLLAVLSVFSCRSADLSLDGDMSNSPDELEHGMIVLGEKLEDPYTVENMTKAYGLLYPTRAERKTLEPTDLYVRFLPAGEDDFNSLESLGLTLLDHPMDYSILREGDYYHDPSIDEDEVTWQYSVVPVGFVFPEGIRYEILDRCYIAENDATRAQGVDWDEIERESFRLTGNAGMLSSQTRGSSGGKPEGRITIVDDAFPGKEQGVKGVKVSCNVFVKVASAFTDEEGNYQMTKSFSSNPRYRLVFKNKKGFAIGFNLLLVQASVSTMGKNSPDGVSLKVDSGSDRLLYCRCAVNNAGWEYYNQCQSGDRKISPPPANLRLWLLSHFSSTTAPMLQQGAIVDDSLIGDFLGEYKWIVKMFLPDITIGLDGKDTYSSLFQTTVHAMAHASHFMQAGKNFWNKYIKFILVSKLTSGFVTYGVGTEEDHGYCEVGEMWAYYMETMLYREYYADKSAVFGTSYWFYPQVFLKLDDKGITRTRIFSALTSDVTSVEVLQDKLVSLYPESRSVINQAFGRYN